MRANWWNLDRKTRAPEGAEGGAAAAEEPAGGAADAGAAGEAGAGAGGGDTMAGGAADDDTSLIAGAKGEGNSDPDKDTAQGDDSAAATVAGAGDDFKLMGAPGEDYVFTMPEGSGLELDEGAVAIIAPVLKELDISQAGAEALMERAYIPLLGHITEQANKAAVERYNTDVAAWAKEAEADPEIGGSADKFAKTMTDVARFRDAFLSKDANDLLTMSGLGNRKEFISAFAAAGRALGEGTFHKSDGVATTKRSGNLYGEEYAPKT